MPPRPSTNSCSRLNSSGAIEVPVGLEGEASSIPRVAGPQAWLTLASESENRSAALVGSSTARPSALPTKCRLHG